MAEPFSTASAAARRKAQMRALIGLGLGAFLLGAVATWVLAGTPGMPSLDLFTVRNEEEAAPAPSGSASPQPCSTRCRPHPSACPITCSSQRRTSSRC